MKAFIFVTILFVQSNLLAQSSGETFSYYPDLFTISKEKYGEKEYLLSQVKELPKSHPLAESVNNNKVFLQYWLSNFVDSKVYEELELMEDEEQLKEEFIISLENDSLFNPLMLTYIEILNVAVKYFNILGITENGSYKGKICAGLNGITATLPKRQPELEAFCFSAILENMEGEEFHMYNEFVAAIRELYKQDLGVERAHRSH